VTTWNYRVFREAAGELTIREVFYDTDGQLLSCSRDAMLVGAESINALIELIDDMKAALRLPILTLGDIPTEQTIQPVSPPTTISHAELLAELGLTHTKGRAHPAKRKAS
jgi:hypothetical protein